MTTFTDSSMQKHIEQQQRAVAFQNSFPVRLGALLGRATVHSYPLSDPALAELCEEHNSAVQQLKREAKAGIAELQSALVDADNPESYDRIVEALTTVRKDKVALARKAVALCTAAVELAKKIRDDHAPHVQRMAAEAEEAVRTVKAELISLGFDVQLAAAEIPAAERQFELFVRRHNSQLRNMLDAAKTTWSEQDAAVQQCASRANTLDEAKKLFRALAVEEIHS